MRTNLNGVDMMVGGKEFGYSKTHLGKAIKVRDRMVKRGRRRKVDSILSGPGNPYVLPLYFTQTASGGKLLGCVVPKEGILVGPRGEGEAFG